MLDRCAVCALLANNPVPPPVPPVPVDRADTHHCHDGTCPAPTDPPVAVATPATLTFKFDSCKTVGKVALLLNYPGTGNWWERDPEKTPADGGAGGMATSTDGQHWEITFAFPVDPNDSTKYLSVPDAHYKWFVDGNPSPVADGGKWSDTCHYEYEERIVTADFTPPEDVVGCLENKAYPATCSAVEPTTFKYTFDACAPTCDADKKPSGCVENVGLQAAVDGLVKDDGEQLGYHWYERAAYAATSVAGSTEWTITFPLTVEHDGKDQVIAVPAAGSTYKWLVNGEYPEQEDTTNVQNVGCSAQYNEYNMDRRQ